MLILLPIANCRTYIFPSNIKKISASWWCGIEFNAMKLSLSRQPVLLSPSGYHLWQLVIIIKSTKWIVLSWCRRRQRHRSVLDVPARMPSPAHGGAGRRRGGFTDRSTRCTPADPDRTCLSGRRSTTANKARGKSCSRRSARKNRLFQTLWNQAWFYFEKQHIYTIWELRPNTRLKSKYTCWKIGVKGLWSI
jgi:hypothetical protein